MLTDITGENMKKKIVSIVALCLSLLWIFIFYRGLPQLIYDPDGVLTLIALIVLDLLLIVTGTLSAYFSFISRSSWWITTAVLAIPAMHALGSVSASPINLICFIFPIAILPILILIKWNASMTGGNNRLNQQ
jgi:hypothetical protein